jgi:hypothetical protein
VNPLEDLAAKIQSSLPPGAMEQPVQPAREAVAVNSPPISKPTGQFVLDEYPETIRISLIDTSRGIVEEPVTVVSDVPKPATAGGQASSGNLFTLLETASSNQPDAPAGGPTDYPPPPPSFEEPPPYGGYQDSPPPPSEFEAADEQQRREAIRQKFLEAIRAAAERRQSGG